MPLFSWIEKREMYKPLPMKQATEKIACRIGRHRQRIYKKIFACTAYPPLRIMGMS